jgi:glyoxylase-like metal-dependent hydrolase (beta-lactamase superfamily II)
MTSRKKRALAVLATLAALLGAFLLWRAPLVRHEVVRARLGEVARGADVERLVDVPGPIEIETVVGADWSVPLSGLVDLQAPEAKRAGLQDREEPIQIYFHALRHPKRGLFLVDTGVEAAFRDDPENALVSRRVGHMLGFADIHVVQDTKGWIAAQREPVRGIFFTHLHFDHLSGLRDVPADVPLFAGPNEARQRSLENVAVGFLTDPAFEGKAPLAEWPFERDPDGAFEGVLDVFGDGSLFALWSPGHTPGSTAYLVRTPHGPVLLTGDVCHTVWGWDHHTSPGEFTADRARNRESLERLERLVAAHPGIDVRFGHQSRALVASR